MSLRLSCRVVIGMAVLIASHSWLAAQPNSGGSSALISEALSQPVQMELNTTLPQAMKTIADKTGVRLEADRSVWDVLPWGDQTRINVKIDNQTLGSALGAITRKLGLDYAVAQNAVLLKPAPPLRRLGRRATADELGALDLLTSIPLKLSKNRLSLLDLVDTADQQLLQSKSDYAIEFRAGAAGAPDQQLVIPRNASLSDALEIVARETPLTWYPWGRSIVIVPKQDQIRNQLQKTITVRYSNADVGQVLSELSQYCGVDFDIEPGAVQRIPAAARVLQLTLENRSIRQALEDISGFTGLDYEVTASGVSITNPRPTVNSASAAGAADPVVAMMEASQGFQLMLRESQVPPDVRQYLRARAKRYIEELRIQMKQENFKPDAPTTQPVSAEN